MVNIVGIVIAASGFLVPYVSNGHFPSIVLFWIGGLLFFNKGVLIKFETIWAKWARIGIWANVALSLIMSATFYLTINKSMTTMGHWLSMIPYWLSRPATALGQQLFPFTETHHPDGSVSFHMGFARTVIADFFDVALFALVAVAIGSLRQKRIRAEES
jgi:hypothetical protein